MTDTPPATAEPHVPQPMECASAAAACGREHEDVLVDCLDLLAGRVRELEGALKGLIDECLFQGDSRKPRPALAQADAVLWMRDRRPRCGPFDPVHVADDFAAADAYRDQEAPRRE